MIPKSGQGFEDPPLPPKAISLRLPKNAQMQGPRNPESGVTTNKERLLATLAS